jgi:HEPN domain-containing protein
MNIMLNRQKLKNLAVIRLREANTLLQNDSYDGAYYLAGYAIECALKSCIAKQVNRYDFPDLSTVKNSYTHKLTDLFKTAGLWMQFQEDMKLNNSLELNWTILKDWSEISRYEEHTQSAAQDLISAIADRKEGVLKWIKQHW